MRIKIRGLLIAALFSLIIISLIWQFAEVPISLYAEKAAATLSGKPFNQIRVMDSSGIPQQLYRNGERHHNPLFIAVEASELYENGDYEGFIRLSDWLLNNLEETDSTAFVSFTFDYPKYNQRAPWQSALTQAVGMVTLAQRAEHDQDHAIQNVSSKMLNTLRPESAKLSHELEDGALWFMEYPSDPPYYSLSGMISTLIKLHEYHALSADSVAISLFERGRKGLITKLPDFDYHGFSYYNLNGVKAGRMYHQRHFRRLAELNELAPHPILQHYQKRWQEADRLPVLWQFIFNPRPKRILAFALAWMGLGVIIAMIQRRFAV
jgi:hypothetical protein